MPASLGTPTHKSSQTRCEWVSTYLSWMLLAFGDFYLSILDNLISIVAAIGSMDETCAPEHGGASRGRSLMVCILHTKYQPIRASESKRCHRPCTPRKRLPRNDRGCIFTRIKQGIHFVFLRIDALDLRSEKRGVGCHVDTVLRCLSNILGSPGAIIRLCDGCFAAR